jgi:chaperonin GroES
MKIKPLGDKVLIRRLDADEKTAGGIVIPDSAKEKPQEGKVIAVGDGRQTESGTVVPFTVKKNDKVLFSSYAGTEITIDGVEHLVMSEDEILAVIE